MRARARIHTEGPENGDEGAVVPEAGPDERDPHAVDLGRRGASRGGRARARKLTAQQRSQSARNAAAARWSRPLTPGQPAPPREEPRGARRRFTFTVKGREVRATRAQVERALRGVSPEAIRRHWVRIGGVCYPVKQAMAVAFGLPRQGVESGRARRVLAEMGFEVGSRRAGEDPHAPLADPAGRAGRAQAGIRPRFPRASGLPRPAHAEVSEEDGEPAAQVQVIAIPPLVLAWSPWQPWDSLREDERQRTGSRVPLARSGVYEVMAKGQRVRLTIGRTSDLRFRIKHNLVMGLGVGHAAHEAILANEDTSKVYVRWALTDRPAAAEEALHLEHKRRHGRMPKYTQRT